MPNIIDANGLQTATKAELKTQLDTALEDIYGVDINLDQDSPDGQWENIIIQLCLDLEDLLVQIYTGFDPDQAIGAVLDMRCAINGIQRQGGTYSEIAVNVTVNQSCTIYGLNEPTKPLYTIENDAGTRWVLKETFAFGGGGVSTRIFRALEPGATTADTNTLTVPATIVVGVTGVSNPGTVSILGTNQETDAALRLRRSQSVSLASQGYLKGLLAAILNVPGVTSAYVYENDSDITDADGVPSHSIWVIVDGNYDQEDVANAIYRKRNAGCGMFGEIEFVITTVQGDFFIVRWDDVEEQNLFIAFTLSVLTPGTQPNTAVIREDIPSQYIPSVNESVNVNGLATVVQQIDPNALVLDAGFSTGYAQNLVSSAAAASGSFKIRYNGQVSALINWNDLAATVHAKINAVPGLETAIITGGIIDQAIGFDLSPLGNVEALILATDNTLLTGGALPVTITMSTTYLPALQPSSKKFKWVLTSPNIYIKPMQLRPAGEIVLPLGTVDFDAAGGYGGYTFSMLISNSGSPTINATSGVYTAGALEGTDTVKVVDQYGNSAAITVVVSS